MKTKLLFFLIAIFLIQGCALEIGRLNPNPKLNLSKTSKTLSLLFSDDIKDAFLIPEYSGIKKSKVSNWHKTLEIGFNNGFGQYFILVDERVEPNYLIKLIKTELVFIPTTVSGYNNTTELKVEIKFQAKLLNEKKESLNIVDEIAKSSKQIKTKGQVKEAVESAVEDMYEIISNKFFTK